MKSTTTYIALMLLFFLLVIPNDSTLKSQSLQLTSGFGSQTFFDLIPNTEREYANYTSGNYYMLKLDMEGFLPEYSFLDLTVKFEKGSGSIDSYYMPFIGWCGVGFTPRTNQDINSTFSTVRMGIGFMPVHFSLSKGVLLKIGAEVSRTIHSLDTQLDDMKHKEDILINTRDEDVSIINKTGGGLLFELQLGRYKLNNGMEISPIYNASLGLNEEIQTGFFTRALRQSIGIGLRWNP
ncbi:MAG: hypothetical protein P1U56_17850 [Saprospiraceae bacterium]|nr:hypothetical protein [Saprospiraceae bacterium]